MSTPGRPPIARIRSSAGCALRSAIR
jgi:hypothetical protein